MDFSLCCWSMPRVALLLWVFAFIAVAQAGFQFECYYNRERCFEEEIPYDVLVTGKYHSAESSVSTVNLQITNPESTVIFRDVDGTGSFAFTSSSAGPYTFCFSLKSTSGQKYLPPSRVDFDLRVGVDAEELSPLEVELRKLEDASVALNKHMNYMRKREAAMRNTNESSNSRVLWLSVLSMMTLVGLGVTQIMYLKRYFRSRKLINQ